MAVRDARLSQPSLRRWQRMNGHNAWTLPMLGHTSTPTAHGELVTHLEGDFHGADGNESVSNARLAPAPRVRHGRTVARRPDADELHVPAGIAGGGELRRPGRAGVRDASCPGRNKVATAAVTPLSLEAPVPDGRRFEDLVLPHLDAAYNLARWLAREPHDAEDVVQDACIRALKYLDSLQGQDARGWFLTIVRNTFYDWVRRNRPADVVTVDDELFESIVDPAAVNPEQHVVRGAEMRALSDAIAALPLAFREVLVLRELEDLSYKEIARIAGIPIGTVMSRLSRARAILQRSPALAALGGQRKGAGA
jgi:RNA polymerase sigma-70 factor (ECF subfamily)